MGFIKRILHRPFFIRLLNWEYWSFGMIYYWIMPIYFLYCLRARSFFFFSASNPTIENGGFTEESKKDIYPLIPKSITPFTLFFDLPANAAYVVSQVHLSGMLYPMIGKPNKGGKGRGVKVLKSDEDLVAYVKNAAIDFHIQEFVSFPKEAGIFYYRMPGEDKGHVTGIVRKEFLSVTGDGIHTIRQLLHKNQRALLQMPAIEKMHGTILDEIPEDGEKRVVVPYGNHARGAMFLDDRELIDEELRSTIDKICKQIDGFYFGRLDIRYSNWEELKEGKNFSIIEVNGAGSEPTHIYDPRNSLFYAWKEIIRHWGILYKVSRANHRRGIPYLTTSQGLKMFRDDKETSRRLASMPE